MYPGPGEWGESEGGVLALGSGDRVRGVVPSQRDQSGPELHLPARRGGGGAGRRAGGGRAGQEGGGRKGAGRAVRSARCWLRRRRRCRRLTLGERERGADAKPPGLLRPEPAGAGA